jgi:glutathione S-transferase
MQNKAKVALAVLDRQLSTTAYLSGRDYTIADMALYAYTHVAHEAHIELAPYPAVERWLDRVQAQPGYVGMRPAAA